MADPKTVISLPSGFTLDVTNLYGADRVTAEDIAGLSERLKAAHQAIQHMRTTGEIRGHLSKDGKPEPVLFSQLPYVQAGNLNNPESIARLKAFGQSQRHRVDVVISFGIGGSYLGNKVLFDVHCGEFWNSKSSEARQGYPKLHFSGNNIDPRRTAELIEHITDEAKRKAMHAGPTDQVYRVTLVVISKSGSTLDTMSTFMVVYDALKQAAPAITVEVVAVTDPAEGEQETLLHRLATQQGWPMFSVPDGVGGRFSIFSEVGLVTAACIGFDIDAFLAGSRSMDEACQSADIWQNPAMLNAALKYLAAANHGRDIEVFMPYADYLKAVAEWYIQLLAESLGKRTNRNGQEVYYGRTPTVAVGTTDMHAQTQLHQDGKRDKLVQFVQVGRWQQDAVIPNSFPSAAKLADIAALRLSQALDAAREANAAALVNDNRFNANFLLPQMNAYHLGELLYLLALSVAYEGELANVDAFDQPGVEAYKRLLGPMLKNMK
ncbi:glucose-6-phosphate isomerase [Sporomusa sp.]|uniref:glucose-6-phosphate isomerase n=1 Tax=Sporomusa sp. TaxID=2078658 RepID=UPI002C026668|nr:glucose-6-phosphate isomerase [Sporomusa sp.]HWR07233.1 glucose-6-phosphate isomerase [Sporomusa sp.]